MELLSSPSCVRLVNLARGEMSAMLFCPSPSAVRLVNPARGEMSVMLFCPSSSTVRLVNPARGEISDIKLYRRSRYVSSVAASSPVKLVMSLLVASRPVNHAISSAVMMAPRALPRNCSMALRRLGSGMFTVFGGTTMLSNATVTPLLWSTSMWVLKDRALRGFPITSTEAPFLRPIFATRGKRSDMELS